MIVQKNNPNLEAIIKDFDDFVGFFKNKPDWSFCHLYELPSNAFRCAPIRTRVRCLRTKTKRRTFTVVRI
jgi:hypothetical protein